MATTIRPTPTWWSLVTAFTLIYREFTANYVIRITSHLALNKDRLFAKDGEYISSKMVGVDAAQFELESDSLGLNRLGIPKSGRF